MARIILFITALCFFSHAAAGSGPAPADTLYMGSIKKMIAIPGLKEAPAKTVFYSFILINDQQTADTLFFEGSRQKRTCYYAFSTHNALLFADTTGTGVNPFRRPFPDYPFIGHIPVQKQDTIRVSVLRNDANIRLYNRAGIYEYIYRLQQGNGVQMLINTLTLGFQTFVFLFFLFYAWVARQRLYTLYALYLGMSLLFCLTMWNELPPHAQAWNNYLSPIHMVNETAVAWMFVFYIFFGDKLLGMSAQNKLLGRLLRLNAIALAIYGLWHLLARVTGSMQELVQPGYFYFRIIFLPLYVVILLFIIFTIRSPLKPFLLIANAFLLSGVIISVVIDFSSGVWYVAGNAVHPGAILQLGIVGETICFSLALGYHHQLISRQSEENRQQYIAQLQENNRLVEQEREILARKVAVARQEIVQQQLQIEARRLEYIQAEFEKRIQELTIQSIEAQMNPHFLFNGLNAVRDLVIKNRNGEAMEYMNTFALLLRTSLSNNRKRSIPLYDELECISHYLNIEKLRLGKDFDFSIHTSPVINTTEVEVPPQLLQPVVENAIKHGLRHSNKPDRYVHIRILEKANNICITVTDNGIGLRASRLLNTDTFLKPTQLGLKLTRERLLVFNEQHDADINLTIEELTEGSGTVAVFTLTNKKLP